MFIDTHCHLYDEAFDEDRHEVVERARNAGAQWLLLPNIDANSLGPLVSTCDEWPDLCRPMLGLHPTELPPDPQPLLDRMEQLLAVPHSPFVAVGEVGIDLYWDTSRREEQMAVFADRQRGASASDCRSSFTPVPLTLNCSKCSRHSKANSRAASSTVSADRLARPKSSWPSTASCSASGGS